jgi:group I intron endonuclease
MSTGIIYKITNTVTGKSYIGASTYATTLRFYNHRSLLNRGKHHCKPLQEEWNLYGQKAFEISKIEEVEKKSLKSTEQYYINEYASLGKCYNKE